jgi:integrase
MLKHYFSMAVKWGKAESNPVRGVKMFPEKIRERYLERSEIAALLEACGRSKNKHLRIIVITALNTGARLQEVLHLKVSDLDFANSIIYLEHTKNGDRGKVPMSEYLRAELKAHLVGHKHKYVFCDKKGARFANVRKAFVNALKEAGIDDFRFHDLRHTFASQLAMNGVEGTTLQALGRWKTPRMVMRYTHLSSQHKKVAIDKLCGVFENNSDLTGKVSLGVI